MSNSDETSYQFSVVSRGRVPLMQDFRKLKAWQRAHELVLAVYQTSASLPRSELYGLTSQIRRSCISVAANIAEGSGRNSRAEFAHFIQIAIGSTSETEYYLQLACELHLISPISNQILREQCVEIRKMLASLVRILRTDH